MVLMYDPNNVLPKTWKKRPPASFRIGDPYVDPLQNNRLMVSDVARALYNQRRAASEMTVNEFYCEVAENHRLMQQTTQELYLHPNLYSSDFVRGYDLEESFGVRSFSYPLMTYAYFRVNELYDEQVLTKINECVDENLIKWDDPLPAATTILEANICPISRIYLDDVDAYDYVKRVANKAQLMKIGFEGVSSDRPDYLPGDTFTQGDYIYDVETHLQDVATAAISVSKGYMTKESSGLSDSEIRFKSNPEYYTYEAEPVYDPRICENQVSAIQEIIPQDNVAWPVHLPKIDVTEEDLRFNGM